MIEALIGAAVGVLTIAAARRESPGTTSEATARKRASAQSAVEVATLTFQVKVKPNARASSLVQTEDGQWVAQLKAAPVDGKANQELVSLVARQFGCSRTAVSIKSGASGRVKLVQANT